MNDISKILIYGVTYYTNKQAFELGMDLLKKQNKSQQEEVVAKSFRKIMNCVAVMFGFSLLAVIITTLNFMLALIFLDTNLNYILVSLIVLLCILLICPICMVISGIMPRSSAGKDWIDYYNSHSKSL